MVNLIPIIICYNYFEKLWEIMEKITKILDDPILSKSSKKTHENYLFQIVYLNIENNVMLL
jgi:hypothetical protein